jgi:hypothetical protein
MVISKPAFAKGCCKNLDRRVTAVVSEPARISTKGFEQLEEQIDDCLTAARSLDREVLHNVIGLLRKARNEIVWKLGL